MKIIELRAENVKRLSAVSIRPDGNMVQITGKNGAGKTSVLDAIWWALEGADNIQIKPIRRGSQKAKIRLDLGELVIQRRFNSRDDGTFTTTITVENADGARYPSPQRMIDGFLGQLSFDPLAFNRMKPREQFDTLKRFVEDVDFAAIETANKADFETRTEIGRDAQRALAAFDSIVLPEGCPTESRDVSALVDQLNVASRKNAEIERQAAAVEAMEAEVTMLKERGEGQHNRSVALFKQAEEAEKEVKATLEIIKVRRAALDALPPPEEPVDTAEITAAIDSAGDHNELVRKWQERGRHALEAEAMTSKYKALTETIATRNAEKQAAIEKADLPVSGLGFGDGHVLLGAVPFEQASDAEQLRASIAIAMASNPKLKVIRVRDGSYLDSDGMKMLADMAEDLDYQVWIERVDESGKVGFVLEDGHLKGEGAEEESGDG